MSEQRFRSRRANDAKDVFFVEVGIDPEGRGDSQGSFGRFLRGSRTREAGGCELTATVQLESLRRRDRTWATDEVFRETGLGARLRIVVRR